MRAREKAVVALVVLVAIAAIAGCRQVVDIADRDPPLQCSAPAFVSAPACDACLSDRCCVEVAECQGDAVCSALLTCVAACTDDACRGQCESTSRLNDVAAALFACQASRCDVRCGLTCGGAGTPISGCQPCSAACCSEGKAFRGDLDGQRLRACRGNCPPADFGCRESCSSPHPRGADLERAASECVERACGAPGSWTCIGRVEPRRVSVPTIIGLQVDAMDQTTKKPLSGVSLKACSAVDLACATPLSVATTAANGSGQLAVHLTPDNGLDAFAGFIELTRPDYVPSLFYFVPPVTANAGVAAALVSRAESAQIEQSTGMTLAPGRGALGLYALDCDRTPRPGISFTADTADSESHRYYLRTESAGGAAYDFDAKSTTATGSGGFVNVPAGPVAVTSRVEHLCLDSGFARVVVRAGAITTVALPPTPKQ